MFNRFKGCRGGRVPHPPLNGGGGARHPPPPLSLTQTYGVGRSGSQPPGSPGGSVGTPIYIPQNFDCCGGLHGRLQQGMSPFGGNSFYPTALPHTHVRALMQTLKHTTGKYQLQPRTFSMKFRMRMKSLFSSEQCNISCSPLHPCTHQAPSACTQCPSSAPAHKTEVAEGKEGANGMAC